MCVTFEVLSVTNMGVALFYLMMEHEQRKKIYVQSYVS
jgi:hypothetical protein